MTLLFLLSIILSTFVFSILMTIATCRNPERTVVGKVLWVLSIWCFFPIGAYAYGFFASPSSTVKKLSFFCLAAGVVALLIMFNAYKTTSKVADQLYVHTEQVLDQSVSQGVLSDVTRDKLSLTLGSMSQDEPGGKGFLNRKQAELKNAALVAILATYGQSNGVSDREAVEWFEIYQKREQYSLDQLKEMMQAAKPPKAT